MRDRVYAHLRMAKITVAPFALLLFLGGCSVSLEDTLDEIASWFGGGEETTVAAPATVSAPANTAALRPAPDPFAKEAYCLRENEYLALSSAMCYQAGGTMVVGRRPAKADPTVEPKPQAAPRAAVSASSTLNNDVPADQRAPLTIDSASEQPQEPAAESISLVNPAKPVLPPPAAFAPPAAQLGPDGKPLKVSVPPIESLGDPKVLNAPPTARMQRPPSNGEVIMRAPSRTAAVPQDEVSGFSGIQPAFGGPALAAPTPQAAPSAATGVPSVFPQPVFGEVPPSATTVSEREVLAPLPPKSTFEETAPTAEAPMAAEPSVPTAAPPSAAGGFMRGPAFGTTEETILGQPKGSLLN